MHISLDGFVAGPKGEMDWIRVDQELFDYAGRRIGESDTAMYGRVTYQMMENYWPEAGNKPGASRHDVEHSKWYNQVHKVVLSRTLKEADLTNTRVIADNLSESIQQIKQSDHGGSDDILLFGSPGATHALMQQQLIDGYWLFVNPVILGCGIPLFKDVQEQTKLRLVSTRRFTSGVCELNYLREQ